MSAPVLARPDEPPVRPVRPTRQLEVRPPGPVGHAGLDLPAVARAVALWVVVVLAGVAVVAYLVGPLLAAKTQQHLLSQLRDDVSRAAGAVDDSLLGAPVVTRSPELGDPVGLVQVPRLGLQQVVVEGASPAATRAAAGHVPGTAAPGQPGNAVVAGRRALFGAGFSDLSRAREGDEVLVSTTQGQVTYVVSSVRTATVGDGLADATPDDRLTLITSGSRLPWSSSRGTVVVATMRDRPFTPTPQNGRAAAQDGHGTDTSVLPLLVLCLLALGATAAAATVLYRRWSVVGTYVVTTPPLLALLVFTSLAAGSLLPAWA